MKKEPNEIKRYVCYAFSGVCFLIGIIRMLYGVLWASDPDPWYDYFIELLFMSFIGAMVIRLSRTYK